MLPSFRLIVATFCCGFVMVLAGLRLATSINGIHQAMPVMAAHAAPVMVAAFGDQDLRRGPAAVPVMYDLRFAVSAAQPAPTPAAASPVIDRAPPLMMPLVILPPIAQEAEPPVLAALPAQPAAEPAPLTIDIPLPEPVTVDLTFSPPAIDIPLPEPAAVDLTFSPPANPRPEAGGRGDAGQRTQPDGQQEKRQERQQEKQSETDARSTFAVDETREPVSDVAAQPLTVAALETPVGIVEPPTDAIPLPRPKLARHAAVTRVAKAKPRRTAVRTAQRNDFDSFFGPSGKAQ